MNNCVSYSAEGTIAVISINNPPVNALSHAVREGVMDAIGQADSDKAIAAIVLICTGRTFIAGADITEFGKPPKAPSLVELVQVLSDCPKPVTAAIHGTALGGGLETALACRYRIALATARVGLPEVNLGLIPGAGGTQRLPRIAGLETALEMITSGRPVSAAQALHSGIVDEVVEGDKLLEAAMEFSKRLLASGKFRKPIAEMDLADSPENQQILESWTAKITRKARGQQSPLAAIDAIKAGVSGSFAEGQQKEREIFMTCMASPQSKALRHIFFAERAAAKLPPELQVEPAEVKSVGVIGGGNMGQGIAICFANSGYPVKVIETNQENFERALLSIGKTYAKMVSSGRITEDRLQQCMALVSGSCEHSSLADADLVVEAAFEDLQVKREIFKSLGEHCKSEAIFASNTSYLDVAAIASAVADPTRVLGMHFFSPAHIMKLLEVVRTSQTSAASISTLMAVGKKLGKTAVLVGNDFGFAANRMYAAYGNAAQRILLEGTKPSQLDRAMKAWGMAMGPTSVWDLSGLDIGYNGRAQNSNPPADPAYFRASDLLVENGLLGRKSNAGFYRYDTDSGDIAENEEALALIRVEAQRLGIEPRENSDTDIQKRMLKAAFEEGKTILADGIANKASDLDVIWVNGYGLPRWRGGPMHYAQEQGWT